MRVLVDERTPVSAYLNSLVTSGLTAWAGMCKPACVRPGDTVFVSAAAVSVGSLAVRIAKICGATEIASAGTAEKVEYCVSALGADAGFCYRDGPVGELLRDAALDGIDVYFDNVGGDHLTAALECMNIGGRIEMCGAISGYSGGEAPTRPDLFTTTAKSLTVFGFLANIFARQLLEFREQMSQWRSRSLILESETIASVLPNAPAAFIDMLSGVNTGKTLADLR